VAVGKLTSAPIALDELQNVVGAFFTDDDIYFDNGLENTGDDYCDTDIYSDTDYEDYDFYDDYCDTDIYSDTDYEDYDFYETDVYPDIDCQYLIVKPML